MAVRYTPVTAATVRCVAKHMRAVDRAEVYEATRRSARDALACSVARSKLSVAVWVAGEPVAIAGVAQATHISLIGHPWLLATHDFEDAARRLHRDARAKLAVLARGYDTLHNYVHADNVASIRWLTALGFTIGEPEPFGWRGAPFRPFTMDTGELHV